MEWEASSRLTLRAGYSYTDGPIQPRDVMFNIIAPAVVKSHYTAGAKFKVTDSLDVEFQGMYAPSESVVGTELPFATAFGFPAPNNRVEIEMHQYEITAGLVYHFGEDEEEPLK